ncbi:MAG: carbon-nitrogen hydrolase family protein [Nanoarchaeota archaeon]|nr:carbon-nitrogen hydrolase family protein [Nanoarchaeota archaeon]
MVKVAAAQIEVTKNTLKNLDKIIEFIKKAASKKVDIVCFPEASFVHLKNRKTIKKSVRERVRNIMKIKPEHLKVIRDAVNVILERNPNAVQTYETVQFPKSERVKDLQTRFNWDLFHAANVQINLHDYLNDGHISTALKAICPTVTRHY